MNRRSIIWRNVKLNYFHPILSAIRSSCPHFTTQNSLGDEAREPISLFAHTYNGVHIQKHVIQGNCFFCATRVGGQR